MKLTVEVTENDILQGVSASCTHCPIARALWRHAPSWSVTVDPNYIALVQGTDRYIINTPKAAREFIRQFDYRINPRPFTFELSAEPWPPANWPLES